MCQKPNREEWEDYSGLPDTPGVRWADRLVCGCWPKACQEIVNEGRD